jgi:hypothetical protein
VVVVVVVVVVPGFVVVVVLPGDPDLVVVDVEELVLPPEVPEVPELAPPFEVELPVPDFEFDDPDGFETGFAEDPPLELGAFPEVVEPPETACTEADCVVFCASA